MSCAPSIAKVGRWNSASPSSAATTAKCEATRRDADAWTSLTGSQPRWRESASDYDDEPEIAATVDDDYDSEAAAEEFFEFDDENNADFDRFMADEQRLDPADEEPAPIPINVLYPSARMLPPRVRAFIDAMSEPGAAKLRIRLS